MSLYIVDASVAAKWFTDEDDAAAALVLLNVIRRKEIEAIL